jgi:hypothetical protein
MEPDMSDRTAATRTREPEGTTKAGAKRERRVMKSGIRKYGAKRPSKREAGVAGARDAKPDTAAFRELVAMTTAAVARHFATIPEERRSEMLERVKKRLVAADDPRPSGGQVLAELRRAGAFGTPVGPGATDDGGADIPARNRAALARAFARAEENKVEILKRPDMLRGEEIAERLNLSRARVDQRRVANQLLALELGTKRGVRYPAWQCELLEDATVRAAFESTLSTLATLASSGPWSRYRFFLQPAPALGGRTPVEALKAGEGDAVRRAAEGWTAGEQGGH